MLPFHAITNYHQTGYSPANTTFLSRSPKIIALHVFVTLGSLRLSQSRLHLPINWVSECIVATCQTTLTLVRVVILSICTRLVFLSEELFSQLSHGERAAMLSKLAEKWVSDAGALFSCASFWSNSFCLWRPGPIDWNIFISPLCGLLWRQNIANCIRFCRPQRHFGFMHPSCID